jgi:hypothetical protein
MIPLFKSTEDTEWSYPSLFLAVTSDTRQASQLEPRLKFVSHIVISAMRTPTAYLFNRSLDRIHNFPAYLIRFRLLSSNF